jgi:ABC-type nitrate/sulfonate/bicarbonate transport system substrate-binding protein
MKRLFALLAALATVALIGTAVATATVSYDANFVGSVGKGDVQTALGYGNGNDTAFQADAALGKIKFSLQSDEIKAFANGAKCAPLTASGGIDMSTVHTLDPVYIGSFFTPKTPNVTVQKNNQGKVTGYLLNGATTGDMIYGPMNYNVGT